MSKTGRRKKAAAEMLVLALLEERNRHGYEIVKLIEQRSGGVLKFHVASLCTPLYRLDKRGQIRPVAERQGWREFIQAVNQVAQLGYA